MTESSRERPFGPPALTVRPLVTTLPAAGVCEPLTLQRRLRGPCLLESLGPRLPTTRRSIVCARGLLRLELRGDRALVDPLVPGAERLLQTPIAVPQPQAGPAPLDDTERLKSPSVLDALRRLAGLIADEGDDALLPPGIFGALSYEIVDRFEELPPRRPDPLDEPDASFVLVADMVVFDHEHGLVQVVTRPLPGEQPEAAAARHATCLEALQAEAADPCATPPRCRLAEPDISDERFLRGVATLKEHIRDGDIFQAVLSRGLSIESDADSLDVYERLRQQNPSPYLFHLQLGEGVLLGASPETFLRVEDGEVEVRPIAGTVPRGGDEDLDRRLELQLLLDPKEQAEHVMLLDLARNDVARVSVPGTCRVVQQFCVEKYSHVQHLVSRVRGTLREDLDALHAFRAAANMGTLTGAPKLRAMELIRELEPQARGFYGGAAGYLLQDGSFDSCIVIRSLRHKDGVYHLRTGAGVVWDSVPEQELAETRHKAKACLEAVS